MAAVDTYCPGCSGTLAVGCGVLPCGCALCDPCVKAGLPFGTCPRCGTVISVVDFPKSEPLAAVAAQMDKLQKELEYANARRTWESSREMADPGRGCQVPDDYVLSRLSLEQLMDLARDCGAQLLHERDSCITVLRRLRLSPAERRWADRDELVAEERNLRDGIALRLHREWRRLWRVSWQDRLDADARGRLAERMRGDVHAAAAVCLSLLPEEEQEARGALLKVEDGDRDRMRHQEHQDRMRLQLKRWQQGKTSDAAPSALRWPIGHIPTDDSRTRHTCSWQGPHKDTVELASQGPAGKVPLPRLAAREVRQRHRLREIADAGC
eukprot:TRINITY_DN9993_c0_g2_i1.p1 TRINITY_DN9993_c0_g2~~TRINITY_DN9993_c0_g2_i1.p1  ORF type:complete len:325 (+),score=21.03 TRINITY_DN9993_c0_g2_i1:60-1034(+)